MKRDMNLLRSILLLVEQQSSAFVPIEVKLDGHTEDEIGYHTVLLIEAGLVEGRVSGEIGRPPRTVITRLKWPGHEFLDAAREPSRWKEARNLVEKFGGAPIEVWTNILTQLVAKSVMG